MSELQDVYPVLERVRQGSSIDTLAAYQSLYQQSVETNDDFWAERAREELIWDTPFSQVNESDYQQGNISWFADGELNVCYNCVDRHLPQRAQQTALLWEGDEPGVNKSITYQELYHQVCQFANVLTQHGVTKGDRVAIYMPMIPQAVVAMLACARIGAVHSVVFAGFSAEALRDRILDSDCQVVLTADQGLRGSKRIPLKQTVDDAVAGCANVRHVIVTQHTGADIPWVDGRDVWLHEATAAVSDECPCVAVNAEDHLFLLYTSGSTGRPKGLAHSSAGYLLYAKMTHRHVFDYREGDIYVCVADIGWITGHSYVVYGLLANGATTVLFESIPTYPDCGRYWDMVERLKINIFYTAPTAIRAIAAAGDEYVTKYDRSSLRVLGSVGEPINPEAWRWYYEVVGDSQCTIVDTWWQTETGGIMITPLPGVTDLKPGSATRPFFGIQPVLLDGEGQEISGNDVSGVLAMKASWPGQARTIFGDHERFLDTYLRPYPGYYFTGDGCRRDEDGYYWITGRVDDVINVSGHRMGTAEVESALVAHEACAEAAVVGFPHDIKGQGIFAYVLLNDGFTPSDELVLALRQAVRSAIGPIATPDHILIAPGLPKTRSGKIMRRILRKIAANEADQLGDISTLADPSVVKTLINDRSLLPA